MTIVYGGISLKNRIFPKQLRFIEYQTSLYQEEKLGWCLGPAANYSNEMSQYILKDTMYITTSHTVRSLISDEDRDLNIIWEEE